MKSGIYLSFLLSCAIAQSSSTSSLTTIGQFGYFGNTSTNVTTPSFASFVTDILTVPSETTIASLSSNTVSISNNTASLEPLQALESSETAIQQVVYNVTNSEQFESSSVVTLANMGALSTATLETQLTQINSTIDPTILQQSNIRGNTSTQSSYAVTTETGNTIANDSMSSATNLPLHHLMDLILILVHQLT
ncbi:unnamed protein product [Cyberlindnera jadinii]|uniref:Uncharacterized protein n=1 Tax=Cyberlindnera jadinii (strain ATCC 18201 / CBS 1600 / BCRC 20928 / JCM 3617 / NBRC 0987 / NRRL Y-1542) TaxID=983966 RepID=A0A0H5C7N1_CYBJN|nr:unnamed protein product [Cyberlindnera jadinii]